mmetsp:Transcript_21032/g.46120  ORF Transcript_21032/g.46120 Transcript_21032/m.46120 type:complete len:206 (-) Transcript_21032:287-904(-)
MYRMDETSLYSSLVVRRLVCSSHHCSDDATASSPAMPTNTFYTGILAASAHRRDHWYRTRPLDAARGPPGSAMHVQSRGRSTAATRQPVGAPARPLASSTTTACHDRSCSSYDGRRCQGCRHSFVVAGALPPPYGGPWELQQSISLARPRVATTGATSPTTDDHPQHILAIHASAIGVHALHTDQAHFCTSAPLHLCTSAPLVLI